MAARTTLLGPTGAKCLHRDRRTDSKRCRPLNARRRVSSCPAATGASDGRLFATHSRPGENDPRRGVGDAGMTPRRQSDANSREDRQNLSPRSAVARYRRDGKRLAQAQLYLVPLAGPPSTESETSLEEKASSISGGSFFCHKTLETTIKRLESLGRQGSDIPVGEIPFGQTGLHLASRNDRCLGQPCGGAHARRRGLRPSSQCFVEGPPARLGRGGRVGSR